MSKTELTFGEKAVGLNFNPSQDNQVDVCKQGFAKLIDQMNDLRETSESPGQNAMPQQLSQKLKQHK